MITLEELEGELGMSQSCANFLKEQLQAVIDKIKPEPALIQFLIDTVGKRYPEIERVPLQKYIEVARYSLKPPEFVLAEIEELLPPPHLEALTNFIETQLCTFPQTLCAEALFWLYLERSQEFLTALNASYASLPQASFEPFLKKYFVSYLHRIFIKRPQTPEAAVSFDEVIRDELIYIQSIPAQDEDAVADLIVSSLSKLVFFTREAQSQEAFTEELRKELYKLNSGGVQNTRLHRLVEDKMNAFLTREFHESSGANSADLYEELEGSPGSILGGLKSTPQTIRDYLLGTPQVISHIQSEQSSQLSLVEPTPRAYEGSQEQLETEIQYMKANVSPKSLSIVEENSHLEAVLQDQESLVEELRKERVSSKLQLMRNQIKELQEENKRLEEENKIWTDRDEYFHQKCTEAIACDQELLQTRENILTEKTTNKHSLLAEVKEYTMQLEDEVHSRFELTPEYSITHWIISSFIVCVLGFLTPLLVLPKYS